MIALRLMITANLCAQENTKIAYDFDFGMNLSDVNYGGEFAKNFYQMMTI